jgi:CMP-N,N'-diacetyllegionaminic acid synthase
MIHNKSVLTIIPARGGSKGLPRKNILRLRGKPLVAWSIQTAKKSMYIDRVVVSTDDQEIAEVAKMEGGEVPFLRPADLATDDAKSISVIEHAVDFLSNQGENYDYCVFLEPTSPLTEPADVDKALQILESKRDIADSIVGVSRVTAAHPLYNVRIDENGLIRPFIRDDFSSPVRRQEVEELYFLEGSLYVSDLTVLLKAKSFYHKRTLPFIMPKWKSFEIDDLVDFVCIEAIMNNVDKMRGCD